MSTITIAGVDISLTNLGMVKGKLDLSEGFFDDITIDLVTTKPSKNKTVVKRIDDVDRMRQLYLGFTEFMADVDAIFIELPTGSQTANAAKSYAISCYTLATTDKPFILVDPKYLKKHSAGQSATKDQMIAWARKNYPDIPIPKAKAKAEHIADAFGAIHAGITLNEFKLITTGMK